jgi:hypothetical protein
LNRLLGLGSNDGHRSRRVEAEAVPRDALDQPVDLGAVDGPLEGVPKRGEHLVPEVAGVGRDEPAVEAHPFRQVGDGAPAAGPTARDADVWDDVWSALLSLDRDHYDRLRAILEQCCAMSMEYISGQGGSTRC